MISTHHFPGIKINGFKMGKNFLFIFVFRTNICTSVTLPLPLLIFIHFLANSHLLGERAFWMIPGLLFNGSVCSSQTLTGMLILLRPCWWSQYFRLKVEVQWSSWIPFSLAIHPSYYYNLQILNLECLHSNLKQLNNLTHKIAERNYIFYWWRE